MILRPIPTSHLGLLMEGRPPMELQPMSLSERVLVALLIMVAVVLGLAFCSYAIGKSFERSADRLERVAR